MADPRYEGRLLGAEGHRSRGKELEEVRVVVGCGHSGKVQHLRAVGEGHLREELRVLDNRLWAREFSTKDMEAAAAGVRRLLGRLHE
jgi:hypothetical protein